MTVAADRVRFGDVLRVREFRALWLAYGQSMAGDQLARVALSVLVFQRTASASLTALVYALTFAPAIVGGVLLAGLADRYPRRTLMIICDLIRAGLLCIMALRSVPLWCVCALLVVVVLVGQPFSAAEMALLPDVLSGDAFVTGNGLRMATGQIAQLVGFAGGGVAIAAIGARGGLLADAATFAVSAVILAVAVRSRPAAFPAAAIARGPSARTRHLGAAVRVIARDRKLRTLVGLGWLAGFHVVPEGLAPPYAAAAGGGAAAVGLLMAALPAGSAVGVVIYVRLPDRLRARLIGPLAVAAAIPLMACAIQPGVAASIGLWAATGMFSAYQVQAASAFISALPAEGRGQAIGLATSGLVAVQGIGVLAFGALAEIMSAANAVAVAGLVAVVLALALAAEWSRAAR